MKFAAAALALAVGAAADYAPYPVYPVSSSSAAPVYPTTTSTEAPVYPSSTPCEESTSSEAPVYPTTTSSVYPVYPVYPSSSEAPIYYTTEIVTSMTSYCAEPTTVTYCGVEYTVTEADYITVTDCPCTVSKPVYSASAVYNTTTPCETPVTYATSTYAPIVTAGAGRAAALSGAGLAIAMGAAALL